MLFFWPIILFFYSQKFHLLLFSPAHYSLIILTIIYSTYYISMSESYIIQSSTINYTVIDITVSRFTRDALINAHDAYITVELYNNYYIIMRDIACTCTLAAGVICLLKH